MRWAKALRNQGCDCQCYWQSQPHPEHTTLEYNSSKIPAQRLHLARHAMAAATQDKKHAPWPSQNLVCMLSRTLHSSAQATLRYAIAVTGQN